mgnify:CR=1 FL=1
MGGEAGEDGDVGVAGAQLGQRGALLVRVGFPLRAQSIERLYRVLRGHAHQIFPCAALARHHQFHLGAGAARVQPLADDLRLFHFLRQQHLAGDGGGLGIELLDELGDDLAVVFKFEGEVGFGHIARDQFQGVDQLTPGLDGSFEVLERVVKTYAIVTPPPAA